MEIIEKIIKEINEHTSLTQNDDKLLREILSPKMNLERCYAILQTIFKVRMDINSILAFLVYQLYKNSPEEAEKLALKLNDDEKKMFESYKIIKDLNQLTLSEEVDDIRNMFLALSKDVRVVIIKIAGIMYDISLLNLPLSENQQRFIRQVKEIHVPLSERLGLDQLKLGLEDNVIRLTSPTEYENIKTQVENKREENEKQLELTKTKIAGILNDLKIEGEISYRMKHISSIYKKLHDKNLRFNQIYDLMAMRVIVNSVEECYSVLGRIHAIYKPMPGRVKDYIANPKPNGYKSLHTTIIVENMHPMEIQIRTFDMHKESEYGVYAHWLYKENKDKKNELDKKLTWFRQTFDNAKNLPDEEFIETLKSDLYDGVIFCQTPKGRVIEFPEGATAIDFAYAVHTNIGNCCVGVKINSKIQPITTPLANGDIVEVLTSAKCKGPSRDWLSIAKTGGARSKIKAFFKNELKDENIKNGKTILSQALQDKGLAQAQLTGKYEEELLSKYSMKDLDELYASLGSGSLTASQVLGRLTALYNRDNVVKPNISNVVQLKKNKDGVLVDGDSGMLVRFAGCCNPIEGDEIVGYISRGKGVTIHRHNCQNLKYLEEERLISAAWQEKENKTFTAVIKVLADRAETNISKITTLIVNMKVALRGFEAKDNSDNLVCTLMIEVKNKAELEKVITSLKTMKNVYQVYRSDR